MKKIKIVMSVIMVSLLLILCIYSFSNKQIYSFLGFEKDKVKDDIDTLQSNTTTNTKSSPESATKTNNNVDYETQNNNLNNIYKTTIPEYKLKSMNEIVQIGFEKSPTNLTYIIKSAKKTKYLPGYTILDDLLSKFSKEVMDEKGNLLKDYYYLDIEIAVTNTGSNTTSITVNDLDYISISGEKHEALYRGRYYSEGANCSNNTYYWEETDGKALIPIMEMIMYFLPGQTCEYRACLIVPEEYNSNELYLFSNTGQRSIDDAGQRFIKLDIQEVE